MKIKMKLLDMTLIGLLSAGVAWPAVAQDASTGASTAGSAGAQGAQCPDGVCDEEDVLVFRVRTRGEERPVAQGADSGALQENRRVDVIREDALPGSARIVGKFQIDLPGGGMIWATEDPTLGQPILNVQAGSTVPFEGGRIVEPLRLHGYTNYASFIDRLEVTLYRGDDADRVTPLATITLPVANVSENDWDGALPANLNLRAGDDLLYVARAYGKDGSFDETMGQRIQLVTPEQHKRGLQEIRDTVQRTLGMSMEESEARNRQVQDAIYGRSNLRIQNIPIYGSRVRIFGRDVPANMQLTIDGQNFPVDQERKFVAEFLEPIGQHRYNVELREGATASQHPLDVNVTGEYLFLVALADVTLSDNDASGSIEALAADDRYDDSFITDGRLAFYLKGKVKGKYLITAQADTRERELSDLFDDFHEADPQDVFRRLDPDMYYPVYGDDSTTYRDVDTQGKLYVRVDWNQNQVLWGNYHTGITGTEFGQYNRSLYGAALNLRSNGTTILGDAKSELRIFGSEAETAPGHSEFLGTGGSLYYLRHTDVLPGSDKLVLEVRDRTTGRVEARVDLQRGADYEIDELQGRVILTRPLMQITRENVRTLTRDAPLDGFQQTLLADYEFVPAGFNSDDVSAGIRGRQWLGEHFAVGGTYVDESRGGEDYNLKGVDMMLQAGRGTYLKLEQARTESTAAPIFYSDNGGLSFVERNPTVGAREGDAKSVEARANFKELGWTEHDWSVGAWWRDIDAGFSVARFDSGVDIEEYGAEVLGYFTEAMSLYARYSRAERGFEALEQAQATLDWRVTEDGRFGAELRSLKEERLSGDVDAMLTAISYRHRFNAALEVYGIGQYTVDDDNGAYDRNNLLTLGARYLFGDRSSVGAEVSSGSRGHGGKIDAEYRMSPDHTLYGAYNYSTDSTERDPLFNSDLQNGWTLGQRWRLSNQATMFNESQFLKDRYTGASGIAHTFGMDFYPAVGWNMGFTLMDGELDAVSGGQVDRRAYSVSGGRTDARTQWASKLEYRRDTGAEERKQWVTTNRLFHKINEDWRIALRANYADTQDDQSPLADATLAEVNAGFAWRPHDNTRWALFGRYTYLYDLVSLGQDEVPNEPYDDDYDQKSQVLSFEGIYQLDDKWELAGKLASRWGDYRMGRNTGPWLDSRGNFAAVQVRYHLIHKWEGIGEYRWLDVKDGGSRQGALLGLDREIGENFKVGVGYNFTDFSDDLTDLEYDNGGWFLNLTGYY